MSDWIKPFRDADNQEYSYFSLPLITENLKISKKVFDKACEYVRNGQASIKQVKFGYTDLASESGMAAFFVVETANVCSVSIGFTKDRLLECRCNSYKCYSRYSQYSCEMCVHETAALILIRDYLHEHRPGDSTDKNAAIFLDSFRNNFRTSKNPKPTVCLKPKVFNDDNELSLKVLISTTEIKKFYIVKNLSELFKAVKEGEVYSLGTKYQIDFSSETFTDECKEFAQVLRGWILDKQRQEKEKRDYYPYRERSELKSSIRLYGDRIDRFFELFKEKDVEYDTKKDTMLHLKEYNPRIHLKINKLMTDNRQFEGVIVSGNLPAVLNGNQYSYCIRNDTLCRLEQEYSREMTPLLSLGNKDGRKVQFKIGRKNLAEFYYTILPALRKTAIIEETDSEIIENYLPPEVFFRFYLDVDEGKPECRVETRYGEIGVAIFDLLESPILKEDFRDSRREIQTLETVLQYFPDFHRNEERFLASDDEDIVYDIVENAVPKLMELGEIVSTDRFRNINIRRKLKVYVGVSVESNLLNLEISTDDISQNELMEIIKSYRKQKKYHRLKNGEFINIDKNIAELSDMLETMHISPKEFVKGKMQLPAYRSLYLDKMLEQSQEIYAKRDSHYRQLIKNFKTVNESDFEIPETLKDTMRGYQRFGHKWLRTIENCGFGGILADEMGLGKTLQMISVILAAKEEGKIGTSLIVCPASLVFNWIAEFEKFAPQLIVCPIVGTSKEREELIKNYKCLDVLVTSYDLIKRDTAIYEDCNFMFQILDEAQYIKNHNTAASKSVKLIHAQHKFALTGTPIENRLSELWSIFDYLMPGFLYGYETFRKELETPIVKKSDETASKQLRRMTSPFILRRLKQDVLNDLPDKLEEDYIIRLESEQQHIYDAKVLELRQMLEESSNEGYQSNKLKVLAFLTQIRQICCDPSLLFENYTGESAKKEACMEIVQRAIEGEHRVLIFSQFTSMLGLLEKTLTEQNITYYKITGETSKKKRLELVDEFNNGNTPVFLISLKAGGTGLNLTGADVVIHYDPWWNVAAQNQATDRTHRIGQTKTVTVYKLIAKNTIEEKIQQMQVKKRDLADSVLSGETVNLSSLSKEELIDILR